MLVGADIDAGGMRVDNGQSLGGLARALVVCHKAIWDEIEEQPYELPADKRLTLSAFVSGVPKTAYIEEVGVGDMLPDMPAYLDPDSWVPVPLEATYQTTRASCPEDMRNAVEQGEVSSDETVE